jgi:DmsE family decaheme c-type cytochrome
MRRISICTSLFVLLALMCAAGRANAAGPKQPNPVAASKTDSNSQSAASSAANPASSAPTGVGYVGQETCEQCHADVVKKFGDNPHSKLALMHSGKGVTCESCHGPGQAHVDGGGDVTKIFRFTKATPKEATAKCLECHAGAHPNFERSAHAEAGVSCTSCHSVHAGEASESLLKAPQPKLCYQCHTDVKPAFSQPFHHKVDEGLMKCSDCHDPHGTFNKNALQTTAAGNAVCAKCHSETAGPFAYEHPVVKAEGCVSCHSPHGSPNARLLKSSNINTLCLQCHSTFNTVAGAASPTGPAHNEAAKYVACTSCHTQIHGSNSSNVFFR